MSEALGQSEREKSKKIYVLIVQKLAFSLSSPEPQVYSLNTVCGICEGRNDKNGHLKRPKDSREGPALPGAKRELKKP